jgi:pyruvate kinase
MSMTNEITLEDVRRVTEPSVRKTKIICTMGPASWSVEGLGKLIDAGMNVARLNFSHGDHKGHGECLERLREAMATRKDKPVSDSSLGANGPSTDSLFCSDCDHA